MGKGGSCIRFLVLTFYLKHINSFHRHETEEELNIEEVLSIITPVIFLSSTYAILIYIIWKRTI